MLILLDEQGKICCKVFFQTELYFSKHRKPCSYWLCYSLFCLSISAVKLSELQDSVLQQCRAWLPLFRVYEMHLQNRKKTIAFCIQKELVWKKVKRRRIRANRRLSFFSCSLFPFSVFFPLFFILFFPSLNLLLLILDLFASALFNNQSDSDKSNIPSCVYQKIRRISQIQHNVKTIMVYTSGKLVYGLAS